jgi:hypothetical protein
MAGSRRAFSQATGKTPKALKWRYYSFAEGSLEGQLSGVFSTPQIAIGG